MAILTSSLTETVLAQVIDCSSSAQIWSLLQDTYASQSGAQVVNLRLQLTSLKKGGETTTEFFNRAKGLVTALAAAGQPISDSEFVIYLLAGLGSEYDSLVTSLSTQPNLPKSQQVLPYLFNFESRSTRNTEALLSTPPSANNTQTQTPTTDKTSNHSHDLNYTASKRGGQGSQRGRGSYRGRGTPVGRNQAGGRGSHFRGAPDNRPPCEVCSKPGHSTLTCWYRFDHAYQAPPPPQFHANYSNYRAPLPQWYPDTAASHHYTPVLSNLRIDSFPYHGTDQVMLGDGSSALIAHHGSSSLYTPNHIFSLTNLLHTPSISKIFYLFARFVQIIECFLNFFLTILW